jgi:hypothetical protein
MRVIALFTVTVFLMGACAGTAQQDKIDFSGEWALNAEKSDMGGDRGGQREGDRGGRRGGGMGMGASKMIIEQQENKLVVETFRKNRDGEDVSTKLNYTLDGKKSKNDLNFGSQESVAKWAKDGKTLVIESTMNMSRGDRDFTIESTEKWSLDKDTLTIESTRSTPMGDRTSKAVYDKVKKEK